MLSTRELDLLPSIPDLLRITKGLAALDAILCADWEGRYHSFDARWAPGELMASMRNGSGDFFNIWFAERGVAMKGFAHEYFMSPYGAAAFTREEQHGALLYPGLCSDFPPELGAFLKEPAFMLESTTFLLWRLAGDDRWRIGDVAWPTSADAGDDPDGSAFLMEHLDGDPARYAQFAGEYFEREVQERDVARVLALGALDEALIERLSGERTLAELASDLQEIGYLGA